MTTRANLEKNKGRILLNTLPRIFREAVLFVRKLNIRYLWIDTLCIIPEDAEDWDKEASQMADIYRNSYLTICAAYSSNCDGGLFSTEPVPYRKIETSQTSTSGDLGLYVRHYLNHIFP